MRKTKPLTKLLKVVMIFFAALFLLLGVTIFEGFMLPGTLLVIVYMVYNFFSRREYEYTLSGRQFSIDVIIGGNYRRCAHLLELDDLEVVAPNQHSSVAKYRKNGGSIKLPKYDYTSYDDTVPYYTMIIMEDKKKIKLLLDLDEEMLRTLKRFYPQKVFLT